MSPFCTNSYTNESAARLVVADDHRTRDLANARIDEKSTAICAFSNVISESHAVATTFHERPSRLGAFFCAHFPQLSSKTLKSRSHRCNLRFGVGAEEVAGIHGRQCVAQPCDVPMKWSFKVEQIVHAQSSCSDHALPGLRNRTPSVPTSAIHHETSSFTVRARPPEYAPEYEGRSMIGAPFFVRWMFEPGLQICAVAHKETIPKSSAD